MFFSSSTTSTVAGIEAPFRGHLAAVRAYGHRRATAVQPERNALARGGPTGYRSPPKEAFHAKQCSDTAGDFGRPGVRRLPSDLSEVQQRRALQGARRG